MLTAQDIADKRAKIAGLRERIAVLRQKIAQVRELKARESLPPEDFEPAGSRIPLPQSKAPMDVIDPTVTPQGPQPASGIGNVYERLGDMLAPRAKKEAVGALGVAGGLLPLGAFSPGPANPVQATENVKGMAQMVPHTAQVMADFQVLADPKNPGWAEAASRLKDRSAIETAASVLMAFGAVEAAGTLMSRFGRGGARPVGAARPVEEPVRPAPEAPPVEPRPTVTPTEQYAAPAGPPTQVKQYGRPIGPKVPKEKVAPVEPAKPLETIEAAPPDRFPEPVKTMPEAAPPAKLGAGKGAGVYEVNFEDAAGYRRTRRVYETTYENAPAEIKAQIDRALSPELFRATSPESMKFLAVKNGSRKITIDEVVTEGGERFVNANFEKPNTVFGELLGREMHDAKFNPAGERAWKKAQADREVAAVEKQAAEQRQQEATKAAVKDSREREEAWNREYAGAKFKRASIDVDGTPVSGPSIGGLMVQKMQTPGRWNSPGRNYAITHIGSKKFVVREAGETQAQAKMLAWRLSRELDWTKPVDEITKTKGLGNRVAELIQDVFEGRPTPLRAGGGEGGKPKSLDAVIEKQSKDFETEKGETVNLGGGMGAVFTGKGRGTTPRVRTYTPEDVNGPTGPVADFWKRTKPTAPGVGNWMGRFKESVTEGIKERFIPFHKLRGEGKEFFANARNRLRLTKEIPGSARRQALEAARNVVGRLSKEQVDIMGHKVFVDDLLETIDKGKKVPEGLNRDLLMQEKERIDGLLKADPDMKAALDRHRELFAAVREELIGRGKLDPEQAMESWVHHEVLEYAETHGAFGVQKKLKRPFRGYLQSRKGSLKDINTDYLSVVYKNLAQTLRDNAIDDAISGIAKQYHKPKVEGKIPEGYEEWTVHGHNWLTPRAKSLAERIVAEVTEGTIKDLPPDIKSDVYRLVVGTTKAETYNIPRPLAETLNTISRELSDPSDVNVLTSRWKGFVLNKNPIRYNRKNLIGDTDRAWNAVPESFKDGGGDRMKRVVSDIWNARVNGKMSADYKLAMEQGVVGSGVTQTEVMNVRKMPEFRHLTGDLSNVGRVKQMVGDLWTGLQEATAGREEILRLQTFYANLERSRAGKPQFTGISDVKGMTDPVEIAGKVAREALGDYGDFTAWENKTLRNGLAPFYSWFKINSTFWPLLIKRKGFSGKAGASMAARTGLKAAGIVAKATAIYSAAAAWNNTVMEEEEQKLPEYMRKKFHIVLPAKDKNGRNLVLTDPTALSDFFESVGLESVSKDVVDLLKGRTSVWDFVKERGKQSIVAPTKKAIGLVTPAIKAPVQALTGRKFFPDPLNPTPGESGVKGFAEGIGAGEFLSKERLSRAYDKPSFLGADTYDADRAALGDVTELSRKFKESKGYRFEGGEGPNTDNNREFFNAIAEGDKERAKKIGPKITTDSFRAYVRARDPYQSIPERFRDEFMASLSPEDRERLRRAQNLLNRIRKEAGV